MRSIILFALILNSSLPSLLNAQLNQEWVRSYNGPVNGNDEALTHTTDTYGNVYVAGKILGSATGFDIYVVKYNSSGSLLWEKIYNGPGSGNDIAYSITIDRSGNVFVAGESKGSDTNSDYVLIKYNTLGVEQWSRRYNGESNSVEIPARVITDSAGNSVITGHSWETGTLFDFVTIKYNSEGNTLWTRKFNGEANGNELANDLDIDNSGNIYVTGSTIGAATINDFVIIKYSAGGDELWTRTYNGPVNGNDNFTFITIDNNSNAVITGSSAGSGTGLDFATIKYSPSGDVIWLKRFTSNSVNFEEPKAIAGDSSGNIYVTGTSTGSSSYDYMTVKYSAAGEEIWARRYNGPSGNNFDEPRSVTADNCGNVFVTGLSAGTGTMDDIVTIKYNSVGDELWVNRFNSAANRDDAANNISLDIYGNVIVSGFLTSLAGGTDFGVIKFSQLTGIVSADQIPGEYRLYQNYPNPFNPGTVIKFSIPFSGFISLKVFDISGKEVAVIFNGFRNPGTYEIDFDASQLSSGTYFYRMISADQILTKKFILIR